MKGAERRLSLLEGDGVGLGMTLKALWERLGSMEAAGAGNEGERKTLATPLNGIVYAPFRGVATANALPKPTAANLRRFAETPVARRAINCIKDRIACMDWRIEVVPGMEPRSGDRDMGRPERTPIPFGENKQKNQPDESEPYDRRVAAVTRALFAPNEVDSFRTLIEQVIEDVLVGGFGAAEIDVTGDPVRPVRLYPVDGATIQVNPAWTGRAQGSTEEPRYAQVTGRLGDGATVPLRDDELMYVRLNPRTHTVFGLGKLEVAFETISQFMSSHRYAGRLASNSVVQYALWMNERTPEQHERLIRWWQDEVEGTGRVPVLNSEQKPEVLRFGGGTDADLRLQWQEFLLGMIANAFDLPPIMLGVQHDVNRSTAAAMQDEAFSNAVVPVAKLISEHITRDVIGKSLGWCDLRFVWNDLESRDEVAEVEIQTKLLAAGVLTVNEVRAMRGLPARVA